MRRKQEGDKGEGGSRREGGDGEKKRKILKTIQKKISEEKKMTLWRNKRK